MTKRAITIFSILFTLVLTITTITSHYFKHQGKYLGNSSSHIIHTLECSAGNKINAKNRVYFDSIAEALTQEYRPCKICNPK